MTGSSDDVILRDAAPEDAEALAAIHATAFAAPWSAAELWRFAADRGSFTLVAEDEAGVAGFILCRAIAGEAEVLTLAVRPQSRRRGFGRELVRAALAIAAPVAEAMLLEVAVGNAGAIALYDTLGFVEVGRRPGYYVSGPGPAGDALVMRRPLNTWRPAR